MAQENFSSSGLVFIKKATGTSVSTISIDNCFSSTYSQYRIIFDISASVGQTNMRLRANGADNSSTNYRRQYFNIFSTSRDTARDTGQSAWLGVGSIDAVQEISICEILNPFQTKNTNMFYASCYQPVANTNLYVAMYGINVTTSYDGFTILPDVSGTITGTIYVYGYVNS
jgi:hypothetical protein